MGRPLLEDSVGKAPRKLTAFYYCCQTMHNFVYLVKLHEPLAKHEKNLVSAAKSLRSSNDQNDSGTD